MVIEAMWGLSYEKPARHVREYLSVLLPLVREGKVSFNGEVYRTNAGIRVPGYEPMPVMISALAPLMLKMAGELTDGTITWMTGAKTIESHIAPKLHAAASAAGRPQPRIAVGLPIAVADNVEESRTRAGQYFQMYGTLPNYRRVLDKEGVAGPADVVITGNEAACEQQLRAIASAGATDFFGAIYPVGDDAASSMTRTRALLQSLIGKL
jgi:F420-dependent oxidoreductase-like protein